jgi:ABC-type branched-subunit amino acid transport system permease subunit
MSAALTRLRVPQSTLLRSLAVALLAGVALLIVSELLGTYNDLQLASGCYYFVVLAGLTMLTGLSGQISLGHGALMAVGAYTVALLVGNEHWALVPALVAAIVVTAVVGILVGAAATRLRGPYLAGATLAFAIGLPALADKFPNTFGGENGLIINPPTPPSGLGANFPLERWEAWIAGAGALVVVFLMRNITRSGVGRSFRAVRDDEIAASLCGLHVGRVQTLAFIISAACAGLGGGLLAVVLAVAVAADRGRARRAGIARWRDLGRGGARAATQLEHRPGALVLVVEQRLEQPAAGDLRPGADRRDARVADRHPGWRAEDRCACSSNSARRITGTDQELA